MIRSKDIQTAKKEIISFRRQLKTVEKDILKAGELAKNGQYNPVALERKERHFRAMKRKLEAMEEHLKALQEGQEPAKVKPWLVSRPVNEGFIISLVEA